MNDEIFFLNRFYPRRYLTQAYTARVALQALGANSQHAKFGCWNWIKKLILLKEIFTFTLKFLLLPFLLLPLKFIIQDTKVSNVDVFYLNLQYFTFKQTFSV